MLNQKKSRLSVLTKKDQGNLTVKDFTDDIYNSKVVNQSHFVEGHSKGQVSDLFTNMCVVVPKAKIHQFQNEIFSVMKEYYEL